MNYIAFAGHQCVAQGDLAAVAVAARKGESVLVFDAATSQPVDLDLRGTPAQVRARYQEAPVPEPQVGRPKLGVVGREVTLLPRHWEWLNQQPGGASVALRKLVEEARKTHADQDRLRQAQESAYRFLTAVAGNLPGFESALRALFGRNPTAFRKATAAWPDDVKAHAERLLAAAGE